MVGGEVNIKCGQVGKPCPSIEDYPECVPAKKGQTWNGLKRILIKEFKDKAPDLSLIPVDAEVPKDRRDPIVKDDPLTLTPEDELAGILNGNFLQQKGYNGICRSSYQGAKNPYKWYAYKSVMGEAGMFAMNKMRQSPNRNIMPASFDEAGFELTFAERTALQNCKELKLTPGDVFCKEGLCPERTDTQDANGRDLYTDGTYFFTDAPLRLHNSMNTGIIQVLMDKKVKMYGISMSRRLDLANHLQDVRDHKTSSKDFLKSSGWIQILGAFSSSMVSLYFGKMIWDGVVKRVKGHTKDTDLEKEMREKLERVPDFEIGGREREADKAWRSAGKARGSRNILVNGRTGSGKKYLVLKMILMKIKGDPRVPERWRDAKFLGIRVADIQGGTKYRGTFSDKIVDMFRNVPGRGRLSRAVKILVTGTLASPDYIFEYRKDLIEEYGQEAADRMAVKAAKKHRVTRSINTLSKKHSKAIIHIEEADGVFGFGGTSDGSAESGGRTVLDFLTTEWVKENVLLIIDTSRHKDMLKAFPDLDRRFNAIQVKEPSAREFVHMQNTVMRPEYEKDYKGIVITPETLDAAARLEEGIFRLENFKNQGVVPSRMDAMEKILTDAVMLAQRAGHGEVSLAHLLDATSDASGGIPIDPTSESVKALLDPARPLSQVTVETNKAIIEANGGVVPDGAEEGTVEKERMVSRWTDPKVDAMLEIIESDPAIDTEGMFDEELREWARAMYEHLDADPAARARFVDAATGCFKQGAPAELFKEVGGAFDSGSMEMPSGIARSREVERFEEARSARESARRGKTVRRGWKERLKARFRVGK